MFESNKKIELLKANKNYKYLVNVSNIKARDFWRWVEMYLASLRDRDLIGKYYLAFHSILMFIVLYFSQNGFILNNLNFFRWWYLN